MSSTPVGPNFSGQSLLGADGKPRQGWGLVEAPEVKPTDPGKLIEAPKFGDVDASQPKPGVPSDLKAASEEPKVYTSEPGKTQPAEIEHSEPPAPVQRSIEVAGTGMGASKKYKMLESEALAVYTIMRDNKGSMKPADLAAKLKEKYGIDADVTTVDGRQAVVNRATGNTVAVDTNGNGSLDMSDLQFKDALLAAGIDPDWKANPKVFDLATSVVQKAIEESEKRRKESEIEEVKKRAARVADLVARDRELNEALLNIRFDGDRDKTVANSKRHDELLTEINRNRLEGIVPLVAELDAYVKGAPLKGSGARDAGLQPVARDAAV